MDDAPWVRRAARDVGVDGQDAQRRHSLRRSPRREEPPLMAQVPDGDDEPRIGHRVIAAPERLLHRPADRAGHQQRVREAGRGDEMDPETRHVEDRVRGRRRPPGPSRCSRWRPPRTCSERRNGRRGQDAGLGVRSRQAGRFVRTSSSRRRAAVAVERSGTRVPVGHARRQRPQPMQRPRSSATTPPGRVSQELREWTRPWNRAVGQTAAHRGRPDPRRARPSTHGSPRRRPGGRGRCPGA